MQAKNWLRLDKGDADLASGGPVVFPNDRVVGGGKQGVLYVVDPGALPPPTQTRFQAFYNTWHPETDVCDYDASQINGPNIHGSPVVWHPAGVNYSLFYGMPEKEYLKGFRAYDTGQVDTSPDLTTIESGYRSPDKMPGGFLSISSNGGQDGIVWALVARHYGPNTDATYDTVPGRLLAFDALTLRALWSDDAVPGVNFVKFVPPTIADGKVFRVSYNGEVPGEARWSGGWNGSRLWRESEPGYAAAIPAPTKRVVTAGWIRRLNTFISSHRQPTVKSSALSFVHIRQIRVASMAGGGGSPFLTSDQRPAAFHPLLRSGHRASNTSTFLWWRTTAP